MSYALKFIIKETKTHFKVGDTNSDRVDQEIYKEKDLMAESIKHIKEVSTGLERQLENNQGEFTSQKLIPEDKQSGNR